MIGVKEYELSVNEVITNIYDSFEEYADHLFKLEDRGYILKDVTYNHVNDKMIATFIRKNDVSNKELKDALNIIKENRNEKIN